MASDLPVDLLEEIFLCLGDTADLARASAVCTSFRRIVSHGRFLRRFRTLHRRQVLGLLLDDRCKTTLFCPAQPPRQSGQAAAGFTKAADFNFAHVLPDRKRWRVCDVRDGRLLLTRWPNCLDGRSAEDLMVYDPLHRRHIQIPTISGDLLLAAAMQQDGNKKAMTFDSPFLTPAVDDDDDDDESLFQFQVMCIVALSKTELVAFVFSSASGQWRHGASFHNPSYDLAELLRFCRRQHVHGRVCWARLFTTVMLVFDTREMKFSIADLPRHSFGMWKMAVEAGDGRRLGLLLLSSGCQKMDLYSKAWQEPEEWRHDSSIPIMPGFHLAMLTGAAEGYAILRAIPQDQYKMWIHTPHKKPDEVHYFTLDVNTLLVDKLCVLEYHEARTMFLYASFPPLFFNQAS